MNNTNKKVKTTDEFEILRNHILDCTTVSMNGEAMVVALNALDQARKRIERDAKLLAKFSQKEASMDNPVKMENVIVPDDVVHVTQPRMEQQKAPDENDDELMEWHDVPKQDYYPNAVEDSLLGQQLARLAISEMATAQTTVGTPLAAVALALHAALRCTVLQFSCTGIPEKGPITGFAPPVRELPKSMFIPNKWDESPTEISIRYRKNGVGSVVLHVTQGETVQVQLVPTISKEPPTTRLEFSVSDYVNMDSIAVAIKKDKRVLPALHYKSLAVLMTKFCNTFDLGTIFDKETESETPLWDRHLPYVDTTICPPGVESLRIPSSRPIIPLNHSQNNYETPTIQVFERQPNRGDFSGDLLPAGINPLGPSGGNLMGPDHPIFNGGAGVRSGFGMMPRFDPYGPPGGPQDPNNDLNDPRHPRQPPGGLGIPNNDIARPPNNLSNNMFM